MPRIPCVSDVVIYHSLGARLPAIIVALHPGGAADLQIFGRGDGAIFFRSAVAFDDDSDVVPTIYRWSWP